MSVDNYNFGGYFGNLGWQSIGSRNGLRGAQGPAGPEGPTGPAGSINTGDGSLNIYGTNDANKFSVQDDSNNYLINADTENGIFTVSQINPLSTFFIVQDSNTNTLISAQTEGRQSTTRINFQSDNNVFKPINDGQFYNITDSAGNPIESIDSKYLTSYNYNTSNIFTPFYGDNTEVVTVFDSTETNNFLNIDTLNQIASFDNLTFNNQSLNYSGNIGGPGGLSPNQPWNNAWITNIYGNVYTPSDASIKTNIAPTDLGLDFINTLNPVKFSYITNTGTTNYGFIYQDMLSLCPTGSDIVSHPCTQLHIHKSMTGFHYVCPTGSHTGCYQGTISSTGYYCGDVGKVSIDQLMAPVVKSIQELSGMVTELQNTTSTYVDYSSVISSITANLTSLSNRISALESNNNS